MLINHMLNYLRDFWATLMKKDKHCENCKTLGKLMSLYLAM